MFLALKLPAYAVMEQSHKRYIIPILLVSESLSGDRDEWRTYESKSKTEGVVPVAAPSRALQRRRGSGGERVVSLKERRCFLFGSAERIAK